MQCVLPSSSITSPGCSSSLQAPNTASSIWNRLQSALQESEKKKKEAKEAQQKKPPKRRLPAGQGLASGGPKRSRQEKTQTGSTFCESLSKTFDTLRTTWRRIVGIDMSLTNPGLCVLDLQQRTISLFCFRNRKRERSECMRLARGSPVFNGWTVRTTLLSEWPETAFERYSLPRFARYEARVATLMALIGPGSAEMMVGIEAYAFSVRPTRGDSILKELGGVLRLHLCRQGHKIMEIVPSQAKRTFCNQGNAKKKDMYRAYTGLYKLPCLFEMLNVDVCAEPPHPIEDVVDALGVAIGVATVLGRS